MATREEQDLDALNVKVNAILAHLGIEVDNAHSDRVAAEQKAREYWAVGGEGWQSINGKPPEQSEDAAEEAERNQEAIMAVEAERQAEMQAAAQAEADAKAAEAQALLDAQQAERLAQFEAVAERQAQAEADADEAEAEAEEEVVDDVPSKKNRRNN